jgi:hypothetical protein
MDYLPPSVTKALEGAIVCHPLSPIFLLCYGVADDQDPHSQQIIETHSQTFFIALTVRPPLPSLSKLMIRQSHSYYHISPNRFY